MASRRPLRDNAWQSGDAVYTAATLQSSDMSYTTTAYASHRKLIAGRLEITKGVCTLCKLCDNIDPIVSTSTRVCHHQRRHGKAAGCQKLFNLVVRPITEES